MLDSKPRAQLVFTEIVAHRVLATANKMFHMIFLDIVAQVRLA